MTTKELEARVAALEKKLAEVEKYATCQHRWYSRGPARICDECGARRE